MCPHSFAVTSNLFSGRCVCVSRSLCTSPCYITPSKNGVLISTACVSTSCRALRVCEQKPLYLALLGILERSGRSQLAAEVWRTATKKFNTSCKVGMAK